MNVFDLHSTLWLLQFPGVREWNPICRAALTVPGMLAVYKYAVFPVFLWCLYRLRQLPLARKGITLAFGLFGINTIYQLILTAMLM